MRWKWRRRGRNRAVGRGLFFFLHIVSSGFDGAVFALRDDLSHDDFIFLMMNLFFFWFFARCSPSAFSCLAFASDAVFLCFLFSSSRGRERLFFFFFFLALDWIAVGSHWIGSVVRSVSTSVIEVVMERRRRRRRRMVVYNH
jgi:hypothetical protein